jgi:excinuclease UvrABC helicase subunit UvrB
MDRFKNFFDDFDSLFNDSFFNQFGENKTEKDSNGDWVKQTYTSKDGSIRYTTFVRTTGKVPQSKQNLDTKIGDLKAELESLVEKQDFEKACEVRDLIKSLENNSETIKKLNKELDIAVKEQNFEKAIEIRDQLKSLQK